MTFFRPEDQEFREAKRDKALNARLKAAKKGGKGAKKPIKKRK